MLSLRDRSNKKANCKDIYLQVISVQLYAEFCWSVFIAYILSEKITGSRAYEYALPLNIGLVYC